MRNKRINKVLLQIFPMLFLFYCVIISCNQEYNQYVMCTVTFEKDRLRVFQDDHLIIDSILNTNQSIALAYHGALELKSPHLKVLIVVNDDSLYVSPNLKKALVISYSNNVITADYVTEGWNMW